MKKTEYPEARRKWREWISRVEGVITGLVLNNHIFRRSVEVAIQDRAIDPNNIVFKWAVHIYPLYAVVAIRRMLDPDKKTFSLLGLIKAIEANPQVVTRDDFVEQYSSNRPGLADRVFDRIAGAGAVALPKSIPSADRLDLESLASSIRPVADKVVAHLDKNPGDMPQLRWPDLHGAIAKMEQMCIKYLLILKQSDPSSLLPSVDAANTEKYVKEVWGNRAT